MGYVDANIVKREYEKKKEKEYEAKRLKEIQEERDFQMNLLKTEYDLKTQLADKIMTRLEAILNRK